VLVIGAGPAGLKAALTIAESGRKVFLVEKSPFIGGLPVRYEEIFPDMECGSCMLEPLLRDVLHGKHAQNIELLTLSEAAEVVGSYGNFTVRIKRRPRYVDMQKCIGCMECVEQCPVSSKNEFNAGLDLRKAISIPYLGALPNVAYVDDDVCLRMKGKTCFLCRNACPIEGAIQYDQTEEVIERIAGAVVLAIGSAIYDCSRFTNLGYGKVPDVYTSAEFERIMAANGPTGGKLKLSSGTFPRRVGIVHCVGSLDRNHKEYCSEICCQYALKFTHMLRKKHPEAIVTHFYRELVIPGKDASPLYDHVKDEANTKLIRYEKMGDLQYYFGMNAERQRFLKGIRYKDASGSEDFAAIDMLILCPAVVPGTDTEKLGRLLEATRDRYGFFDTLHGRMDSARSKIKGVFLAGTCQSPMDIQKAMGQGMAAAGYVLSGLVPGRKLEIEPVVAVVESKKCSGCKLCVSVCPYKAISFDPEEEVSCINEVLCQGCGVCAVACPSGAITARHFTSEEILEEIAALLS
jgi:heterodisulfide reductase subunit A2